MARGKAGTLTHQPTTLIGRRQRRLERLATLPPAKREVVENRILRSWTGFKVDRTSGISPTTRRNLEQKGLLA